MATTPLRRPHRRALTLIEILIVIAIIGVLAGMLVPVIGMVRERSRRAEAAQTVTLLISSCEQYAAEDERKRLPYPGPFADNSNPFTPAAITYHRSPEASEPETAWSIAFGDQRGATAISGVLGLLQERNIPLPTLRCDDSEDRRLLDPWRRPYRYRLGLPGGVRSAFACSHGGSGDLRLQDWNWNASAAQEAKRNGQDPTLARPFPYIYSWGRLGSSTDPCTWIYTADTR